MLTGFAEVQLSFLNAAAESIAIAVGSAQSRVTQVRLLEEPQVPYPVPGIEVLT